MRRKRSKQTRRPWPIFKLAGAVALSLTIVSIVAMLAVPKTSKLESPTGAVTKATDMPPSRDTAMNAMLDELISAVNLVAKGDPFAEGLAARFAQNAIASYPTPDKQVQIVTPTRPIDLSIRHIRVIMISGDELDYVPVRMAAIYSFEPSMNAIIYIYKRGSPRNRIIQGCNMLHELVHWDDFVSGKPMGNNNALDETAVRGELRAGDIEYAAYERWSGGDFLRLVRRIIDEPALHKMSEEVPGTVEPNEAALGLFNRLLGSKPMNLIDFKDRRSALTVAVSHLLGKTIEERIKIYRTSRRNTKPFDNREL